MGIAPTNDVFLQRAHVRIASLLNEAAGLQVYSHFKNTSTIAKELHTIVLGTCLVAVTTGTEIGFKEQEGLCLGIVEKNLKEKA